MVVGAVALRGSGKSAGCDVESALCPVAIGPRRLFCPHQLVAPFKALYPDSYNRPGTVVRSDGRETAPTDAVGRTSSYVAAAEEESDGYVRAPVGAALVTCLTEMRNIHVALRGRQGQS
jgi:hypothetical protein